jgi:hypothetical protein
VSLRLGVLLVPVVAVAALLVHAMVAPVSRARVERFARRQQLLITPDNGDRVIRYLAVTRRWRVAGIVGAVALGVIWITVSSIGRRPDQFGGEVNLLQLFAGWFVGALIAEARLHRTPVDQRRHASLQPRDVSMYVPAMSRLAVPVALAVSLAIGVLTLVLAALGRAPDGRLALIAQAAALAVAGLVAAVGRHILTRPQPLLAPDQLAADDAIRSRSLHVLAGAGTALVLYAVISQLTAVASALPSALAEVVAGAALVLVFAAPLLGWWIATRPWTVRRGTVLYAD